MNLSTIERVYASPSQTEFDLRTPHQIFQDRQEKRRSRQSKTEQRSLTPNTDRDQGFSDLVDSSLEKNALSDQSNVLIEWFDQEGSYFPFVVGCLDPLKSGDKRFDLILFLALGNNCPVQLPIEELRINVSSSQQRLRKVDPKDGEFIVTNEYADEPDFSLFNAQFLFQLLVANGAILERDKWKIVLEKVHSDAKRDLFLHLSRLEFFAKRHLIGVYPYQLFQRHLPGIFDTIPVPRKY